MRVRGRRFLNYETGDNPKPGEVIVFVQPGVIGTAVGAGGRGQGVLVLTQTNATVTPAGPTRKPPFRATSSAANTSKKATDAAAVLALILFVAAGITYVARTRRQQPKPKQPEKPVPADPPAKPRDT